MEPLDRDLQRLGVDSQLLGELVEGDLPVRGTAHVPQHGSDEYIPFKAGCRAGRHAPDDSEAPSAKPPRSPRPRGSLPRR